MLRLLQTRASSSMSMVNKAKYQDQLYDLTVGPPVGVFGIMPEYTGRPAEDTQVTVMPNGVAVASIDTGSPIARLGVFCKAGSRNETTENAGIAHIVRHAWFCSTSRRSYIGASREPYQCGADISVSSTRESFGVLSTCPKDKTDLILDHMTQNLVCPEFWFHEVYDAKAKAAKENNSMMHNADVLLVEEAHRLAFRGKGLGRSLFLKPYAAQLEQEDCFDFVNQHLAPADNLFIVGQGIDHESLKAMTDEFTWSLEAGSLAAPASQYCGGRESHIETGGSLVSAMLLTNGVSAGSKDSVALDLVKQLVGAGASPIKHGAGNSKLMFSAGEHLSKPFTSSCVNIGYSDAGLFGLAVTAHNSEIAPLLKSGVEVMGGLINSVSEEALAVAKTKLRSSILMQDSSAATMEAAANGLMGLGSSQADTIAMIDSITVADVSSALKKVWASEPILVSVGNGEHMPVLKEVL